MKSAEKASFLQASIYIYGEQGSGRRSLARWIHDRSLQRASRFVVWNPDENVAIREGDTVLIENIHELDGARLLRARKAVEDFSSSAGSKVRWIVTSELDAKAWMESSSVARDLAYRLCVVTLRVPRLQERKEDIAHLAQLFLRVCCLVNGLPEKRFSEAALSVLETHYWTGHVAELNNAVERAALRSETTEIGAAELSFLAEPAKTVEIDLGQAGMSLFEMEKKLIFQTLEFTRQNKTRAAQILGISIRTLRNKLNGYRQNVSEREEHEQRHV